MIETIKFKDKTYPFFQSEGNAAQFAIPFAQKVCTGAMGYDIGYGKKEWKFPGAIGIDINAEDERCKDAMNLPMNAGVDYIFSSHCLEYLVDWVAALDHWSSKLNPKGVLFLYLPHYSQEYWRPWNNRKHKHCFTQNIIADWMESNGYIKVFSSEIDLNNSFIVMGEKL